MLQRVMVVAAESLKVLEHQLMDGSQTQDVRVGKKPLSFNTTSFISVIRVVSSDFYWHCSTCFCVFL